MTALLTRHDIVQVPDKDAIDDCIDDHEPHGDGEVEMVIGALRGPETGDQKDGS